MKSIACLSGILQIRLLETAYIAFTKAGVGGYVKPRLSIEADFQTPAHARRAARVCQDVVKKLFLSVPQGGRDETAIML